MTLRFFPANNLHGFKVIFDANAKDRPSLFVHEDIARGEAVIAGKENRGKKIRPSLRHEETACSNMRKES